MLHLIQEVQRNLKTALSISRTKHFKHGFKKYKNDKVVMDALGDILSYIKYNRVPPIIYNAHMLKYGKVKGMWDAHLKGSQILLIYDINQDGLVLVALGSHKDLGLQ